VWLHRIHLDAVNCSSSSRKRHCPDQLLGQGSTQALFPCFASTFASVPGLIFGLVQGRIGARRAEKTTSLQPASLPKIQYHSRRQEIAS
jgi:hypothetical protein